MEQLVQMISDKAGISADRAKSAIEGVLDFLGDKLPGPIADQVKGLVEGGGGDAGGGLMGKVTGGLGGLLGGGDE